MSGKLPGQVELSQVASRAQRTEEAKETTASRARSMAERIRGLAQEVVASFESDDRERRVARLKRVETEVLWRMQPVIGWLERKPSAATMDLFKRRMFFVLQEAVRCASMEIPQYAGGVRRQIQGDPSPGAVRTATLYETSRAFADSLIELAKDIEAEEADRANKLRPTEPEPRLTFDDRSRTITLDGVKDQESFSPEVYYFLKAVGTGERCGKMTPGRYITGSGPLAGKKLVRIVNKLPAHWKRLVSSRKGSGGGYCLTLPAKRCP